MIEGSSTLFSFPVGERSRPSLRDSLRSLSRPDLQDSSVLGLLLVC